MKCNAGGGAIYGIGIFGALIYFLQHASSTTMVFMGIVKAIFWPALIVYKVLEIMNL